METLKKKITHPRDIEIHIVSAKALRSPFTFSPFRHLRSYAVAWIDPNKKVRTKPDLIGGPNPKWDHKFTFSTVGRQEDVMVNVEIYAVGGLLFKDRLIGAAQLSVTSKTITSPAEFSVPSALVLRRPSSPWSSRGVVKVVVSSKSLECDVATTKNKKVVVGGGSTCVAPLLGRPFSALSISTTRLSSSLIVNDQASSSYV